MYRKFVFFIFLFIILLFFKLFYYIIILQIKRIGATMQNKVYNIDLLIRKLKKVDRFSNLADKTQSQKELIKFAESLKQEIDYESLNDIDKKYVCVLHYFDYDLFEIKGTGYFLIKDKQAVGADEFQNNRIATSIFDMLDYFGEHWFEDHNLDMDKVFDDNVKDFGDCIIEVW